MREDFDKQLTSIEWCWEEEEDRGREETPEPTGAAASYAGFDSASGRPLPLLWLMPAVATHRHRPFIFFLFFIRFILLSAFSRCFSLNIYERHSGIWLKFQSNRESQEFSQIWVFENELLILVI